MNRPLPWRLVNPQSVAMRFAAMLFVLLLGLFSEAEAQTNAFPGDGWITNRISLPRLIGTNRLNYAEFTRLHAKEVGGRLKVRWPGDTNATEVTAWISVEPLGNWKSRDWRPRRMALGELGWEATVPVEDLDEPIAYFVSAVKAGRTNFSIFRSVVPREAALPNPTSVFWPFVEGFEEGAYSWWNEGDAGLSLSTEARTGKGALRLAIPERGRSATVFTSRIRGSKIQTVQAMGLRFWVRGSGAEGKLRLTAYADAETLKQTTATFRTETTVGKKPGWQKVELLFTELGSFPVASLDRLAFEFAGVGGAALLLDDVELLGPWAEVK